MLRQKQTVKQKKNGLKVSFFIPTLAIVIVCDRTVISREGGGLSHQENQKLTSLSKEALGNASYPHNQSNNLPLFFNWIVVLLKHYLLWLW